MGRDWFLFDDFQFNGISNVFTPSTKKINKKEYTGVWKYK